MLKHLNFPLSPRGRRAGPRKEPSSPVAESKPRLNLQPDPASGERIEAEWRVECAVLEARDIIAGDKRSQSSDAFVRVQLGKKKFCTRVEHKTLTPKWEQHFAFEVKAALDDAGECLTLAGEGKGKGSGKEADGDLRFAVFDKDLFRNDFLGAAKIDLSEWKIGAMHVQWLPLCSKKGEEGGLGELRVGVRISPKEVALEDEEGVETDQALNNLGGFDLDRVKRFNVRVVEAKDLPSKDRNTFADPYCVVRVGKEKQKSSVVSKSLNPCWNASLRFGESRKFNLTGRTSVDVQVYDKDGFLDRDDLIGEVSVPLVDLFLCDSPKWFTLKANKKDLEAKVRLSAEAVDEPEETHTPAINVHVLRASDLRAADRSNMSDPYCVLELGKKRFKTKVKRRTLDPDWAETFTFEVKPKQGSKSAGKLSHLSLKVMDKDGIFDKDDVLGQLELPYEELLDRAKAGSQEWLDLDRQGRVLLKFEIAPIRAKPSQLQEAPELSRERRIEECSLQAHVVEASNLDRMTGRSKGMDPYCIVRVADEKHQTKVVSNSTCPFWDQVFSFEQPLTGNALVAIEVRDKDILTSKLLARKEFTLAALWDMSKHAPGGELWVELQDIKKPPRVKIKLLFIPRPREKEEESQSARSGAAEDLSSSFERVKVRMLEARGLQASDRNGLADPYCVVRVGNAKKSTNVVKRTLEPKWKEQTFEFSKDLGIEQSILVQVYDQDFALDRNDLMGSLQLPLSRLEKKSKKWYPLKNKKNHESGEVLMDIELVSSSRTAEDVICLVADKLLSFAMQRDKQLDLAETFELYDKDSSGKLEVNEFEDMLKVLGVNIEQEELRLISELFDVDGDGLVDYKEFLAVIHQPDNLHQANEDELPSVLYTVLSKLFSGIRDSTRAQQAVLKLRRTFELFDRSGSGRFRLVKGEISVELNKVLGLAGLTALQHVSDLEVLRIHFADEDDDCLINYEELCRSCAVAHGAISNEESEGKASEEVARVEERAHGRVFVEVLQAQDLCAVDRNGQSDPFCILRLQQSKTKEKAKAKFKAKTSTIKDELNPQWNERFELARHISDLSENGHLEVEVKDAGMLFHHSLGHVSIPLASVLPELHSNSHMLRFFPLEGKRAKGSIQLRFSTEKTGVDTEQKECAKDQLQDASLVEIGSEIIDDLPKAPEIARVSSQGGRERRQETGRYSPQARDEEVMWRSDGNTMSGFRVSMETIRETVSKVAHAKTVQDKGLYEIFQETDTKHKGWLRQRAFLASLEHYGIIFAKSEVDFLMPRLDPEDREELDYVRFCRLVGAAVVTEETLMQTIREAIETCKNSGIAIERIFQTFDVQNRGLLSENDFFRGVSALGVQLDQSQRQMLLELRNQGPPGYVKYMPLLRMIYPGLCFENEDGQGRNGRVDGVIAHLRRRLHQQNSSSSSPSVEPLTLSERFERVDNHGEGRVNLREFRKVLRQVDRGLPEEQIQLLIKAFDCDKDGYVDYTELVEAVGDHADNTSGQLESIKAKLLHSVAGNSHSLARAFDRHDLNGDGKLSRRVFRRILATAEHSLTPRELRLFMDSLDPSGLGFIFIPKFFDCMGLDGVMKAFDDAALVKPPRHRGFVGEITALQALGDFSRGSFEGSTNTVIECKKERNVSESIWEPAFVEEWLNKAATPGERRAFDRLYRASTQVSGNDYKTPVSSPRLNAKVQLELGNKFAHLQDRPHSPVFRRSQHVGWECPTCSSVNRKPSCLNACEMCGTVRSSNVKVIVESDDNSLLSNDDSCSLATTCYTDKRRRSRHRLRQERSVRELGQERRMKQYTSSSDSDSHMSTRSKPRHQHHRKRNSGLRRSRSRSRSRSRCREAERRHGRSHRHREKSLTDSSWNKWAKYDLEAASVSTRATSPRKSARSRSLYSSPSRSRTRRRSRRRS